MRWASPITSAAVCNGADALAITDFLGKDNMARVDDISNQHLTTGVIELARLLAYYTVLMAR